MNTTDNCTWQPVDEFVPKGLFIGSVWNRNKQKAETRALIKRCGKYYYAETSERLDPANYYLTHYQPLPAPVPTKPTFNTTPSQKKNLLTAYPDLRYAETF